ncbi:MAG: hypothetical protein DHS20C18_34080 [Saprospiraceae bacterium]|nr:MAG: hypothetical protein DHS20C18_34080 [Saprospiraceae bacterium]
MTNFFTSKFVQLLKTFDVATLKSFENWLRSPWCNTNKNLIRLLDQLKKYHPEFENKKLTKEKLFHKVLPQGKYSARRMNNLLSEAYLAGEKFLIFQRLSMDQTTQADFLIQEWQGRYLDDWFFQDIHREIDQLEGKPVKRWEDHLTLLFWYRRMYHYPNQNARIQDGLNPILRMEEHLDLVYLLEKAALINEKIFRNRIIPNEQHDVQAALQVWRMASQHYTHPAIELYRMRFEYTEENLLSKYTDLRETLIKNLDALNEKEKKTHLLSLLNDSKMLIKKGLIDITELLPLYQLGLTTGVLFNQGKITLNTYTTIAVISNTKGDFEFTEQFIHQYTNCLNKKIQADAMQWALAHTAYWKKDLETCLNMLQQYDYKITYFQYICRVLNTQVYFELYLQDESFRFYLFNYFDTYEKWLTREKVWGETQKKAFLRFVQKCRQLARYYADLDFDAKKVEKLLENETNIQALNWLMQKQKEVLDLKRESLAG